MPEPKSDSPRVIVYTRRGCHLCDDAEETLNRYGIRYESVDIDADPASLEQYDQCVPVVTFDGKVRFRGAVNETLLRRLLKESSDS